MAAEYKSIGAYSAAGDISDKYEEIEGYVSDSVRHIGIEEPSKTTKSTKKPLHQEQFNDTI